jgi:hypothetical protein
MRHVYYLYIKLWEYYVNLKVQSQFDVVEASNCAYHSRRFNMKNTNKKNTFAPTANWPYTTN